MNAVLRKCLADLRRRKVQTAVIALVLFLSSLSTTLALTLLVETDAPFDRAFEQAEGAHLAMSFSASAVNAAQLQSTAAVPGVAAAVGPWRVDPWVVQGQFGDSILAPLAGRDGPGGPVDRLTLTAGRWAQGSGEVVLAQRLADKLGLQPGTSIPSASDSPIPAMRVVGIVASVGNGPDAWALPASVPLLSSRQPETTYLMEYRVVNAGTRQQIKAVADAITSRLPSGAVIDSSNYLDAKLNADRTTAVMIPFLLAFSVFALLASAFIIVNLVSGAVIAGTRDIGIMKSVGFTPDQVVMVLAGQMLIPAIIGCLGGLPLGILLSQPFLADTAHAFNLPQTFGIAPGPDAAGLGAILLIVVITTILASLGAGGMSAAAAIAAGTSPAAPPRRLRILLPPLRGKVGLGSLSLPRPVTLGLSEFLARPMRSAMTIGAIVIGVATVTFAIGLTSSLHLVQAGISRTQQVQVEVFGVGGGSKGPGGPVAASPGGPPVAGPGLAEAQLQSTIAAQPGTARFVGERQQNVTVAGAGEPVPLTTYRGESSWIGYPIISGRWFHAAGEAVGPSNFFKRTGHRVGDVITATLESGQQVRLTLVGEIFDQQNDNILLRADWATLPGNPAVQSYEIQLRPGTDQRAYASALQTADPGVDVGVRGRDGIETAFLLIESTLGGLALILTLIAAAGVFNTVVLNTREKARDIAILKAIGMTPRQVVTMVLASVAVLGILGAVVGIPAGIALHANILVLMGQIASSTGIPKAFFQVFGIPMLTGLGLAGIAIALLGAMLPAQWAAQSRVTEVLQTE